MFKGPQAVKILSLYGASIGLAPAVGPLLGGVVHVFIGWWANFLLLFILGTIAAMMVWKVIPEGGGGAPFNFRLSFRRYKRLLKNTIFLRFALAIGATFAGLFAFITVGPYLFIEKFGIATEDYGLYYGASVIAYIAGATFANRFAERISPFGLTKIGATFGVLGALVFLGLNLVDALTAMTMLVAMSLFSLGLGMLFAAAPILMFASVPTALGATAGVLFSIGQSAGAALGAASAAVFHGETPLLLAIVMVGYAAFASILVFAGEKPETESH
jgi:DHA1 family bicyclomycin/chloramphenicol resistance-like MFS transporter